MRDTEKLVKKSLKKSGTKPSISVLRKTFGDKDADTKALEGDLSAAVGMKVQVNHNADKENGEVIISYTSLDQLDDICRMLNILD